MKEIIKNKEVSLFGNEFSTELKEQYSQCKIKNNLEMLAFLKQFITVNEEPTTPYKYKNASYKKKAHYINGKKVNRYIYHYIKVWLDQD